MGPALPFVSRSRGVVSTGWAPALVVLFALVALASLVQGMLDFSIPLLFGGTPFALTRGFADVFGPAALYSALFLHNLGLALLFPGCGLLAARFEREDAHRRLIVPLLLGACGVAIALGFATVLRGATGANRSFALALAVGESIAILSVGIATHKELRRFRNRAPTREGIALALASMRGPLVLSAAGLALLALIETAHLVGG